jgi:hypothetical protein
VVENARKPDMKTRPKLSKGLEIYIMVDPNNATFLLNLKSRKNLNVSMYTNKPMKYPQHCERKDNTV